MATPTDVAVGIDVAKAQLDGGGGAHGTRRGRCRARGAGCGGCRSSSRRGGSTQIDLSGVFADADGDALTLQRRVVGHRRGHFGRLVRNGSRDAVSCTLRRGTATITVTARGRGRQPGQRHVRRHGERPTRGRGARLIIRGRTGRGRTLRRRPGRRDLAHRIPGGGRQPGQGRDARRAGSDPSGLGRRRPQAIGPRPQRLSPAALRAGPPPTSRAPTRDIFRLEPEGGALGSGNTRRPKAKKAQVTFINLEPGTAFNVRGRARNALGKRERVHHTMFL